MQHRTRLFTAATVLVVAACGFDRSPIGPPAEPPTPPPPTLDVGSWTLSSADGQALPAYIAHRQVDGRLEQVWVDSARIDIRRDGTWTQRLWTRTHHDGVFQWRTTVVDQGSSTVDEGRYRFNSNGGMRSATVDNRVGGRLEVLEQMAFWPQAGLVASRYVPHAEAPVPGDPQAGVGTFRANLTDRGPLPQSVYWFPDEPSQGGATYYQLDSSTVSLRQDGTYVRRTWFSEWQTTDRRGGHYTLFGRYVDFDRGEYLRVGDALSFSSNWIENQTMSGTVLPGGRLKLMQSLTSEDPIFAVYYTLE